MKNKVIENILTAEKQAEQIQIKAKEEALKIVSSAEEESLRIKSEAQENAKKLLKEELIKAEDIAKQTFDNNLKDYEIQASKLETTAKANFEKVVKEIIKKI